jgi:hypothetical protein
LSACADLRLQTMPAPPASNKLRVFVQPISGSFPKGGWPLPHDVFSERMFEATQHNLNWRGIYYVVPQEDVQAVLGSQQTLGWQWEKNGWYLAKEVGKALYADYTLVIERGWSTLFYNRMVLVNTQTGKNFEAFYNIPPNRVKEAMMLDHKKIIAYSFREIFNLAKADMLDTAIRKGKLDIASGNKITNGQTEENKEPLHLDKTPVNNPPVAIKEDTARKTGSISPDKPPVDIAAQTPLLTVNQKPVERPSIKMPVDDDITSRGKTKLIVYDFNTEENLRLVGMILAEALREELYQMGKFELINRENIGQVMDELKLQQTGLVDEKDAIRIGQWMSANETITGNLALLGSVMILQAKRMDMATMSTLSLGSLRAEAGKSEALLDEIHNLAKVLSK